MTPIVLQIEYRSVSNLNVFVRICNGTDFLKPVKIKKLDLTGLFFSQCRRTQNYFSLITGLIICVSGAGKSRTALLQKRTVSRVKTSRKVGHMINYLLTKLGWAGWENIWVSIMAHRPRCARSRHHDFEPNIFPSGPPT